MDARAAGVQLYVAPDRRLVFLLGVLGESLAREVRNPREVVGEVLAEAAGTTIPEEERLSTLIEEFVAWQYGEDEEPPSWLHAPGFDAAVPAAKKTLSQRPTKNKK